MTSGCLDAIYSLFDKRKNPTDDSLNYNKTTLTINNVRKTTEPRLSKLSSTSSDKFVFIKGELPVVISHATFNDNNKRRLSIINVERKDNETDDEFEMRKRDAKLLTNDSGYSDETNDGDDSGYSGGYQSDNVKVVINGGIVEENKVSDKVLDNTKLTNTNTKTVKMNLIDNVNHTNLQNSTKSTNTTHSIDNEHQQQNGDSKSNSSNDDDDDDDDEDDVVDVVIPLPRRRSNRHIPDINILIQQLDSDALRLNNIFIENGNYLID